MNTTLRVELIRSKLDSLWAV